MQDLFLFLRETLPVFLVLAFIVLLLGFVKFIMSRSKSEKLSTVSPILQETYATYTDIYKPILEEIIANSNTLKEELSLDEEFLYYLASEETVFGLGSCKATVYLIHGDPTIIVQPLTHALARAQGWISINYFGKTIYLPPEAVLKEAMDFI
jgi:hypothetical protein